MSNRRNRQVPGPTHRSRTASGPRPRVAERQRVEEHGEADPTPWWTTWPGAVVLALISLTLVIPPAVVFTIYATLPSTAGEGTDTVVTGVGPSRVLRVMAGLWVVAVLSLPLLTLRWCRKKWAGWMLVGMMASVVAFISALFPLGIL